MENQQPEQPEQREQAHVVPPMMRVSPVRPQFMAPQRKVFIVPSVTAMSLPEELPQTPMPGRAGQQEQGQQGQAGQQRTFLAPSVTFFSLPTEMEPVEQTPRPQFLSGKVPAFVPPGRPRQPMDFTLPQTPMPTATGFPSGVYTISLPVPQRSFPGRPPMSIPGSRSHTMERKEPGVGEMLMGCAVLMVLALVVLGVLYYIAT